MIAPYYSDDLVTLYHGRCEDILPQLAPASADMLLVDPPYFQVKEDEWDRQWKKRDEFLTWLGGTLDAALPALTPSASAWVFASPALTSRVERVIDERFRVLNSIRWVKEAGWHQKADIEASRRYLTAWEGVIFAERHTEGDPDEERKAAMQAVSRRITTAREIAGVSRQAIARELVAAGLYRNEQTGAAMCSDWEYGDSLPPIDAYVILRKALNGAAPLPPHDVFTEEWHTALAAFYESRRPFKLNRHGPVTDVWNFKPVMGYAGKHPCEKPLAMLDHRLAVTARPGATVLDYCAGSGSTLRAAKDRGLKAIGIEMDERWCEHAANRLAQDVLDFGESA